LQFAFLVDEMEVSDHPRSMPPYRRIWLTADSPLRGCPRSLFELRGAPVVPKVLANLSTGKVRPNLLPTFTTLRLLQKPASQGMHLIHNGSGDLQFASSVGRFVLMRQFCHQLSNELVSSIVPFASKQDIGIIVLIMKQGVWRDGQSWRCQR